MKYLVTDDSKLARLSLIKSLKAHVSDADIYQATNGQEAINIVLEEKPDIVFLDLTMPIMDGYEALPLMIESHPNIKVIVISADVQERAKAKVIQLGAKLHMNKPINAAKMKELLEII